MSGSNIPHLAICHEGNDVARIIPGRLDDGKLDIKIAFPQHEFEVFSYPLMNINPIINERMFAHGRDELEALSFVSVLKERETDPERRELLDTNFSDVLLVFDFEGDAEDRFSFGRLEEMLDYFFESTDEGKLYINYPMVEACKHFSDLPDAGYLDRCVSADDVRSYKRIVGAESRFQNYERDFCRPALDALIVLTVAKSLRLCGAELDLGDFADSCARVDHRDIFERENDLYRGQSRLAVLGACPMIVFSHSRRAALRAADGRRRRVCFVGPRR